MSTTEEANVPVIGKKAQPSREVPYKRAVLILVIGDLICFLIFAALGRNSHGESSGFAAIPQIIVTAAPFAAGWFVVSPFVGAFRQRVLAQPRFMVLRTALAWLIAWPVAMLLRRIFVNDGISPPRFAIFAIIVLLFNMLLLLVWRWSFALYNSGGIRKAKKKR